MWGQGDGCAEAGHSVCWWLATAKEVAGWVGGWVGCEGRGGTLPRQTYEGTWWAGCLGCEGGDTVLGCELGCEGRAKLLAGVVGAGA